MPRAGEIVQKGDWEKQFEEFKKILDKQIAIFDEKTSENRNNLWATVYGPLRNLFSFTRDYLEVLDQIRSKTLELDKKNEALEARLKLLEDNQKSKP